jgi:hypothetical protein
MKPLELMICCSLLLVGCSQTTTAPDVAGETVDTKAERQEAVEKSIEDVGTVAATAPDDAVGPEERYLPVADWLVQRQSVCRQEWESIQNQLQRYQQDLAETDPQPDPSAEVVQAYTQLKALMLATCRPARTPGLLKNLLINVAQYEWPPEYIALFDLLEAEYGAYAVLEERYRDLEKRHQQTIDGIGRIEQSLESDAKSVN